MSSLHHRHDAHLETYRWKAHIRQEAQYRKLHDRSLTDPEGFWAGQARCHLLWDRPWNAVHQWEADHALCRWFDGGRLNAARNCIDRHLAEHRDTVAFFWEGEYPSETEILTYGELYRRVDRMAAVLLARGVVKGDRVAIHLPMIPALPVAMLACSRIGAVHTVVFTGFGPKALAARMADCRAKALITVDGLRREGRKIPFKETLDPALAALPHLKTLLVIERAGVDPPMTPGRDHFMRRALADAKLLDSVPPESMGAEDPLFILYVGGVRGQPKGLVHTHGGYLLHAAVSTRLVFDLHPGEVFWSTADMGWIVEHTYGLYGPLLNGATSVLFEGAPERTDPARYWDLIDRYRVARLCWTPTEIRVARGGDGEAMARRDLSSLQLMAFVGEPMDIETWEWAYHRVGKDRCPVIDAYLQTETGAILLAPLPGVAALKPAFCARPFFGVDPVVLDDTGEQTRFPNQEGVLCIRRPWPGMARTIFDDHDRFVDTYFGRVHGSYFTADAALRDEDGDYRIMGRVDDVIKVSGGRLCAAEMEAVLRIHPMVTDAAVVRFPHPVKGEGMYAFVAVGADAPPLARLRDHLSELLRDEIGPIAVFDAVQWTRRLPKTRSGKVMRHILDKIAAGLVNELGDLSAIDDPAISSGRPAPYTVGSASGAMARPVRKEPG